MLWVDHIAAKQMENAYLSLVICIHVLVSINSMQVIVHGVWFSVYGGCCEDNCTNVSLAHNNWLLNWYLQWLPEVPQLAWAKHRELSSTSRVWFLGVNIKNIVSFRHGHTETGLMILFLSLVCLTVSTCHTVGLGIGHMCSQDRSDIACSSQEHLHRNDITGRSIIHEYTCTQHCYILELQKAQIMKKSWRLANHLNKLCI